MRLTVSFLVLFLVGCGGGSLKLYPVTGTLTVDGSPVADISVQLYPIPGKEPGRPSNGVTDKNGRFVLECNGAPGAPRGKYKLVLAKSDPSMGPNKLTAEQLMEAQKEKAKEELSNDRKLPFPEEYLIPDTSPGEVQVVDHEVTLDLKL